jgi:hypothetical protein
MSLQRIDKLIPTAGAEPGEGYDPVSLAGFSLWDVGDEARFSLVVPDTYVAGNDFFLDILESTPAVSSRHQWQVCTLLIRPGVHVTDEQTITQICSCEFQASSPGDELRLRMLQVSGAAGAGKVNGLPIQPGDYLSWVLKRIPASQHEDSDPIKVFDLSLEIKIDNTAVSGFPGRVGRIIDTVRDLFNEANGGFLSDEFIIRSMNRCLQDLAQDDYWRTETWIPSSSGVNRVDLLAAIPDFQALHQVRYRGANSPMAALGSYVEYDEVRTACNTPGVPEYYVLQNTNLLVWPPPGSDSPSGFCVYHSYLPAALGCSQADANPPVPKAHDMVFVYFVLRQAFLRDRHAPGADGKFQEYSLLYDRAKQALLGQGEPALLSLRPRR